MPPTVGDRLKQAREQRGLSLADVAHETRIPILRLQDLEQNSYTSFGSLTYAKGFLRTYARLVEVDASEVLDQFHPPPLGGEQDYKYLTRSYGPWIRQRKSPTSSPSESSTHVMAPSKSSTVVAMVCGGVMLLGVGMLLGNALLSSKPEPETTVAKAIPVDTPDPLAAAPASADMASGRKSWANTDTTVTPSPGDVAALASPPETTTLKAEVFRAPEDAMVVPPKAIPVEDESPKPKARRSAQNR